MESLNNEIAKGSNKPNQIAAQLGLLKRPDVAPFSLIGFWNQTIKPNRVLKGPNKLKYFCNIKLIITGKDPLTRNFKKMSL